MRSSSEWALPMTSSLDLWSRKCSSSRAPLEQFLFAQWRTWTGRLQSRRRNQEDLVEQHSSSSNSSSSEMSSRSNNRSSAVRAWQWFDAFRCGSCLLRLRRCRCGQSCIKRRSQCINRRNAGESKVSFLCVFIRRTTFFWRSIWSHLRCTSSLRLVSIATKVWPPWRTWSTRSK